MGMAVRAQQALHSYTAYRPSRLSSPDSTPSCPISRPWASSLTESVPFTPQPLASNRIRSITTTRCRGRRQPGRTERSLVTCRLSFGYGGEGYLGGRLSPMSSGRQELLLLLLHPPGSHLPLWTFTASNRQVLRVLPRISGKVAAIGDCHPQRRQIGASGAYRQVLRVLPRVSGKVAAIGDCHPQRRQIGASGAYRQALRVLPRISGKVTSIGHQIGASGVYRRSSQRRRAERGDGSESSSPDEREKGKKDEEDLLVEEEEKRAAEDDLEDEFEDNMEESVGTRVNLKEDMKARSWFWRNWWPSRVETEMEDLAEEEVDKELEELEKEAVAEGGIKSEGESAESQQSQDESGKDDREEETASEEVVQNEEAKVGFWRRFWKQEKVADEESLGPEEELVLQELESLTFNWKESFEPTFENFSALGLTALLALALFKILSQLFVVVLTIVLSALKYSILAAFVVGLLIFLL